MSISSAVIDADSKDHLFLVVLAVSCLLHGLAIMTITALKLEKRSSHSSEKEQISVTLEPDLHSDVYLSLDAAVFDTTAKDIVQSPLSEEGRSKNGASPHHNSAKKKSSAARRTGGVLGNPKEEQSNTQKSLDITYKIEEDTFSQKKTRCVSNGWSDN